MAKNWVESNGSLDVCFATYLLKPKMILIEPEIIKNLINVGDDSDNFNHSSVYDKQ